MPIMAAHGQNDARISARLLANTAVDCLRDPSKAPDWEVALNNVYRLLEAYKLNPFFGLEPPQKPRVNGVADTLALTLPLERHVGEVRSALEQAIDVTFLGQSREQAIQQVENVLRGLAYPNRYAQPSIDERTRVTQFFEQVLQRLKFA